MFSALYLNLQIPSIFEVQMTSERGFIWSFSFAEKNKIKIKEMNHQLHLQPCWECKQITSDKCTTCKIIHRHDWCRCSCFDVVCQVEMDQVKEDYNDDGIDNEEEDEEEEEEEEEDDDDDD